MKEIVKQEDDNMSTYDGAYSKKNADAGARVCCCYEERINNFCRFHGKYRDGGFKQSEEYKQLKIKLGVS
jgi:hypothetical protein